MKRVMLPAVRRRTLCLITPLSMLSAACFAEAPQDPATTSATSTTSATESTSATPTADTTAGDLIAECRACQAVQCEGYAQGCMDTPDCDLCVDQPFNPGCLSSAAFRPLAFCSCDDCAEECGYMCPGGGEACRDCQTGSGCDQGPCVDAGMACFPCVADPYAPGCAESPEFMALQDCQCGACEPACVWECENAASACASCLISDCGEQFNNCLDDEDCGLCFNNPSTPGCQMIDGASGNTLYQALAVCVCAGDCTTPCGLLFGC